jgi:hypothetical protein
MQLEAALGHRVVAAVAAPAHTAHQLVAREVRLPVVARALAALVQVQMRIAPRCEVTRVPSHYHCAKCSWPLEGQLARSPQGLAHPLSQGHMLGVVVRQDFGRKLHQDAFAQGVNAHLGR